MNTNTKFVRISQDFGNVFPIAISDNNNYPEIVNWHGLRQFTKTLRLDDSPIIVYHTECPYGDGECHHCNYCKEVDEYEVLVPVYSYELSWKQNRRLITAFCNAWAIYDISGVVRFLLYHRKSLNKTCGKGWVNSIVRKFRKVYCSSF